MPSANREDRLTIDLVTEYPVRLGDYPLPTKRTSIVVQRAWERLLRLCFPAIADIILQ